MKKLILADFHGTIVDANAAWHKAYCCLCPTQSDLIREKIIAKENRSEIAKALGLDYQEVIRLYRSFLSVRHEVIQIIKGLDLPIIIISNASKERLLLDIESVKGQHDLKFDKVYSGEDGKKPDTEYIERVIKENEYEFAYMIGNDAVEDFVKSPLVTNILVPVTYFS